MKIPLTNELRVVIIKSLKAGVLDTSEIKELLTEEEKEFEEMMNEAIQSDTTK